MYSKQEASQIRQEFWTAFGRYMQPIPSASEAKVNWVNYKTGVKHISFRMDAGKGAWIGIELRHPDAVDQAIAYGQLLQLKTYLENITHEAWTWSPQMQDEQGRTISRVFTELEGVHLFNKAHWPQLISFFKPRIIALDQFWSEVRPAFEV